jgi:hypothetical protein
MKFSDYPQLIASDWTKDMEKFSVANIPAFIVLLEE